MPNHPTPVPDFLLALERMILPLPLLPPLPLRPLLLLLRFFFSAGLSPWKLGPCQASFRLPALRKRTRAQKLQWGTSWSSDQVRPNLGLGQRCGRRSRCGSGARARPAAPRAWASRPRVPRCLTGTLANQGVRPGCHVTGEAALFPARPEGGVEPIPEPESAAAAEEAAAGGAAAAQAPGQASAHP